MAKRSYGQYCALARALDLVGDRWVLLIVRELITGPKRFKELLASLPGIGANLLTSRLRDLESQELIRRATLPPPAGSAVYELTEIGRGLETATLELARWGSRFLGARSEEEHFNPEWCALALRVIFRPDRASEVNEAYEFCVDGVTFHARVCDGELETALGVARNPAVRIVTDVPTFFGMARGMSLQEPLEDGRLKVEGSLEAFSRCLRLFGAGKRSREIELEENDLS